MKKIYIVSLSLVIALVIGISGLLLYRGSSKPAATKNPIETDANSSPKTSTEKTAEVNTTEHYGDVKGFLWEVKSGDSTVYLYGSIHVGNQSLFPLHETVEKAYSKSDVLVGEINLNSLLLIKSTFQKSFYKGSDNAFNHLSPEGQKKVSEVCGELGISENAFMKERVWCLGSTLSVLQMNKSGYDAEAGIDKYFMDKAKGKKKIMELEGADFQFDLLNSFSDKDQEKYFISTLSTAEELKNELDATYEIFKSGDENKAQVLLGNEEKDSLFYKKFILDRNINMTSKIEGYLNKDKTYFVVAGLAHFIGQDGIVNLLREKGYTVNKL